MASISKDQPAGSFEEAISVVPLTSHSYAGHLRLEWCIGTVPHGGYITSMFYHVARTHMKQTHPKRHNGRPTPISIHLTFIRRTEIGPVKFVVTDTKLGARTSTLHISLIQFDSNNKPREEVAGYLTISDLVTEEGPTIATDYKLNPLPTPGTILDSNGTPVGVDFEKLGKTGQDGDWKRFVISHSSMRKASRHVEFNTPTTKIMAQKGFIEQWTRFKPYGKDAVWKDDSLGFLIDMFPMMLQSLDDKPWEGKEGVAPSAHPDAPKSGPLAKFWYPTVLLNVDFKKKLPEEGAEWLYSRVLTRVLRNGRMDYDIVILDEQGDIVALSNHIALIVGAERNLSARGSNNGSKI
ncbi:hypothetical protein FQN57_004647 [Myotisia sp. PD_48]|nr:hypothetical protein FQN57_004647 [Myotisia sp. PD_48]